MSHGESRWSRGSWAPSLALVAALAAALALAGLVSGGVDAGEGDDGAGSSRRRSEPPISSHRIRPGEGMADLLVRGGLSAIDVRRLLDVIRPHADWTEPDPATELRVRGWPEALPDRVELTLDRDRTLVLQLRGAVWQVEVARAPVAIDTVAISGRVESTLYAAALGGDIGRLSSREKAQLPGRLADVFAWQIDFWRDPVPGDSFRIALERAVRPDGSIRQATVLAAEYVGSGGRRDAVRFAPSDEVGEFYYDGAGRALRGAFLRAPLDLVRVTSRFSRSRYHPVSGVHRAHSGVDYGAASGTPVRATGDGQVRRAGWAGDLGLLVEIDHGGGIRTRYAHLSGIAKDVVPGATVGQGDVIAAVGNTGLSTAPHLHYEFLRNGQATDPTAVDLPVERPIPPGDETRFEVERQAARALLDRAPMPDSGLADASSR